MQAEYGCWLSIQCQSIQERTAMHFENLQRHAELFTHIFLPQFCCVVSCLSCFQRKYSVLGYPSEHVLLMEAV